MRNYCQGSNYDRPFYNANYKMSGKSVTYIYEASCIDQRSRYDSVKRSTTTTKTSVK